MTNEQKVNDYVKELLKGAGVEGEELIKWCIVWTQFYSSVRNELKNLSTIQLKSFAYKYLLSMVQFETVCIRANKPSGSQSTAKDIIHMYSRKNLSGDGLFTKNHKTTIENHGYSKTTKGIK